jgi:MarR family transcriptional regulator for hemolysin
MPRSFSEKPAGLPSEPEGAFGFLLHDVARLLRGNFNRRVQSLGLTQAQCRVILHLSRNEGIQQVALAEILEVQPITLARLYWINCRQPDWLSVAAILSDRRAFCLSLTASAHPLLERIWSLAADTRAAAISVGEAQLAQFFATLRTMKENLLKAESGQRRLLPPL